MSKKIIDAVKVLLHEWVSMRTGEWSEVTLTVKRDIEGNIVQVGKTAKIVGIRPEWLGYEQPYYLELDPVKPVITRDKDGSVNYDYTTTNITAEASDL